MKLVGSNVRLAPLLSLALLALAPLAGSQTSSPLSLQTIHVTQGGPVQLTFRDTGTGATSFLAEFSPVVGLAAEWTADTTAVITALGGGNYRVDISSPPQSQGFYRVVGFGGGDPAIMNFATTSFQVTEGGMVSAVITFSSPFTGTIRYTTRGTASSGDYVALSGQVRVDNSTTATIPVTLTDNDVIGQSKYLALTLEAGPGLQLGPASQTTIAIDENDADWRGSFLAGGAALGFVSRIHQSHGVHGAAVRSEGAGFFSDHRNPGRDYVHARRLFTHRLEHSHERRRHVVQRACEADFDIERHERTGRPASEPHRGPRCWHGDDRVFREGASQHDHPRDVPAAEAARDAFHRRGRPRVRAVRTREAI